MNEKNRNLIYFLLICIAIITLTPFIFTGFSNTDDIFYYITVRSGKIWHNAGIYAREQGRFYFLFTIPIIQLCYLFENYLIPKSLNILFVLANFVLTGLILKEIFENKWTGILGFILLIVFVSIKGIYNPIVSYPLYFTVSFSLILLSVYFCLSFKRSGYIRFQIFSVVSFAIGLLFYETYLIYLPLLILIIFYAKKESFMKNLRLSLPYLILGAVYCIVYFSYRIFHPSGYTGSSFFGSFNLSKFLDTVLNFTSGAYPLALTFTEGYSTYGGAAYFVQNSIGNICYTILSDHTAWILKSLLVSVLVYISLNQLGVIKLTKLLSIFFISLLFIYLPQVPLSLSEKYLSTGGMPNYVTTYFSFFPAIVCFAVLLFLISIIIKKFKYRAVIYLIISVFIGFASILNDFANYHAIKALRVPLNVFNIIDEFIKTEEYKSIPENSYIYAPDLYDRRDDIVHIAQLFNWSYYFSVKSKKSVTISHSESVFFEELGNNNKHVYFINYGRNRHNLDQYIVLSSISSRLQTEDQKNCFASDSIDIFYLSNNKTFSILYDTDPAIGNHPLILNSDTLFVNKNRIELNVFNKNYLDKFVRIKVKSENINLNSIVVTNIALTSGIPVILE